MPILIGIEQSKVSFSIPRKISLEQMKSIGKFIHKKYHLGIPFTDMEINNYNILDGFYINEEKTMIMCLYNDYTLYEGNINGFIIRQLILFNNNDIKPNRYFIVYTDYNETIPIQQEYVTAEEMFIIADNL